MLARKHSLSMIALVLAALAVASCSSGRPGPAGAAPAQSQPGANDRSGSTTDAAPTTGGGSFCEVVKTSREAMRPFSEDLVRKPTNAKANWEGIVTQWRALAAAAPPELRDDFRVIVDAWNRAGDEASKGGWDLLVLIRALSQQMDNEAFQKAYVHQAGYIKDRCGIDPFNPAPSA